MVYIEFFFFLNVPNFLADLQLSSYVEYTYVLEDLN